MSIDDHTAQKHLTPNERRELLRAFADRMLLKVTAMDDPEDLPGVEKAVRVAAAIERVYSRCDRAERQICNKTPDPRKAEAERAAHETAAIKARVELASTLEWAEKRRRNLGQWWEGAGKTVEHRLFRRRRFRQPRLSLPIRLKSPISITPPASLRPAPNWLQDAP